MYRSLKYILVTATAAAVFAASPAMAKPLTGGAVAPPRVTPAPMPAQPSRLAHTPVDDTDNSGSLLIGIGLAAAGVVVGAAGMARRRRVAV